MASEWKASQIGDCFDLVNGYAFKSGEFIERGIPVIKIKNVKANRMLFNDLSYVAHEFLKTRADKVVQKGDLLITMSGNRFDGSPDTWVGKVAQFNESRPFLLNQRVGILRPKKGAEVDRRFFSFSLSSPFYQTEFISIATSSGGQANLSPSQILGAPIEYPPLPEQRAIAHILGSLDDLIELNRETNEILEEMARALFKSWFVDFDPVRAKLEGRQPAGMDAATAALFPVHFQDSELGQIPKGWEVSTIGEKLKTVLGGTPSRARAEFWANGTVPWINSGKTNEFRIIEPSELITTEALEKSATKLLPRRTTVLAITGATLGQVSIAEIECCANQSVVAILGSAEFPTEFIYPWIKENIEKLIASQTGGAQQHINKGNVEELSLLCPDERVVSAFTDLVRPMFDAIDSNLNESRDLATLRDTLLPKLLSGEVKAPVVHS